MEQAPTGRLPVPRTRSLNSLSTATSDAEAKRSAIRGRSPSMRGMAPPPPPGAARTSASRLSSNSSARSISPSPRVSASTTTRNPSVMSTTGARTITRTGGAPPPPPVRSSMIRVPSPSPRRSSMPDVGEEGLPEGRGSGDTLEEPKRPGHTRASSSASDAGLPKSISRLTQPQAPSFLNRPKSSVSSTTTSRMPPPAPVRKGTPAATAKAQELQARLDALKKTAEQLRGKSVKAPTGGTTGLKRPGERSAPSSPKGITKTEVKRAEEGEVSALKLEESVEEPSLSKEEKEKFEELEIERAKKAQIELAKEEQSRKDSLLVRAAAALERKLAEEKRVKQEKLEQKRREEEEEEIKRKLEEDRRQREKAREEEEEARKKQEQTEQEELERKRAQEEREEQQREEERREAERRKEIEEQEQAKLAREREKEEEERRRLEQERLLQEAEEAEREVIRKRIEQEEEERKRVKEEEERKRLEAEEERRKQKEQEEIERKKQEEERRKHREKEEEERRLQKAKEEEERRKQIEKEEEERRLQIEREAETRRKQQEMEDERRKQELEEERRKQKEEDEKREEERRRQKEREEEERRKQKEKEEEERRKQKEKEEEERRKQKEKEEVEAKKRQQEAEEKKKKDLEEKKARDSQFLKVGRKEEDDEDDGRRSSSNLSNITKAKIGGPARKARSGLKFDARASTDVVRAASVSEVSMRRDSGHDTKDEPRESDLRPERRPVIGAGMNGLAGLAQQAAGGLAALKPLKSPGDRARSPSSRRGPFEIMFGKGDKTAVHALDALDNVAKGHAWVILTFDNDVFSLTSTGEGVGQAALDAMKEHLTPTSIDFLYFNSGGGDKDEGAVKCSEIMWQGEKTKLLVKARAGAIRETLHLFTKRCFTVGVQKEASSHDDLDVSRIFGTSGEVSSPMPSSPPPSDKLSPLLMTPRSNPDAPSPLVSRNSVSARSSTMEAPPLLNRVSTFSRSSANEGKSSPGSNPLRPDIQWTGQEEIAKAVKDFLAAEGANAFIVLDIEGAKKNEVKVAATGVGALTDEWREKHCGATKCSVFILKAENKEAGYVSLEKIVYIQWVGKQVKILEKGRAKEIYSGLKEFVREQTGTLAGEMEVLEGEAKDVNLQAVTESITGSRQRGSAMQGTLTKKVERSAGGPVDLSYADEEELRSIISQISQEKLTWVALTYSTSKPATLEILGSGVGENTSISWGKEPTKAQEEEQNKRDRQSDTPTAQYKKFCKQSNIVFIVHRFLRIPEQFQFSKDMGTYAKSHFGLMMWQGEDCRVMDKAASSHHWKDFCSLVRDIMEKAGVYVEAGVYVATKMEEVNPRDIRKGMRMDMY